MCSLISKCDISDLLFPFFCFGSTVADGFWLPSQFPSMHLLAVPTPSTFLYLGSLNPFPPLESSFSLISCSSWSLLFPLTYIILYSFSAHSYYFSLHNTLWYSFSAHFYYLSLHNTIWCSFSAHSFLMPHQSQPWWLNMPCYVLSI